MKIIGKLGLLNLISKMDLSCMFHSEFKRYIVQYILLVAIYLYLSSCNIFYSSSEVTHYRNAVWSDCDTEILFVIQTHTFESYMWYWDTGDPKFQLATIKPNGTDIVELPVSDEGTGNELYYMKDSGYILFSYSSIDIHYFNSETKTLIQDSIPPSGISTKIKAIPSPDGSKIAIISPLPWCESKGDYTNQCSYGEVFGGSDTPVYIANIKFIDSQTLNTISEYTSEWTTYHEFDYRWDIDENFIIRKGGTKIFYRINPIDSTFASSSEHNFSNYPKTTSSIYSRNNMKVYFTHDDIFKVVPNTSDLGDSPFID